jgi:vacuolar-type H+-ATPase subunit E/Vma4
MALADIVNRIDTDSTSEAASLVAEAQAHASALLASAQDEAAQEREDTLDSASREAAAEAETVCATARLAARDRALAAKGDLVDSALAQARDGIVALDDDVYAVFLARHIAAVARGGERVLVAPADAARLALRLPQAYAKLGGPALLWPPEPAPVEHGVVLLGDRVSVDLSVQAIIHENREALSMVAAEQLFAGAGA